MKIFDSSRNTQWLADVSEISHESRHNQQCFQRYCGKQLYCKVL